MCEIGFFVEVESLLGATRCAKREQLHTFEFNGHLGDHKGDSLFVTDRFTKSDTSVAVVDNVFENGSTGTDRERTKTDLGEVD